MIIIIFIIFWCAYFLVEHFMLPQRRRGMSYDIRGDPYIPYIPVSPWNQPTVGPIRNRPLY
jgi:hypothetical protein